MAAEKKIYNLPCDIMNYFRINTITSYYTKKLYKLTHYFYRCFLYQPLRF